MSGRRYQTLTDLVIADRWRIRRTVGTGAESTVYHATDIRTGHDVAIKLFDNEDPTDASAIARRLDDESRLSRALHSNWLVDVLDVGVIVHDGGHRTPWVAMEYLRGRTLRAALQQEGRNRTAPEVWIRIAQHVVEAVAKLHDGGWLHLDVKPENIFLLDEPPGRRSLKLIDLSSARRVDDERPFRPRGTPLYVAPEVILRQGAPAEPADVYSLGVVLYELFVGRPPIGEVDPRAIVTRHAHGHLEPWPRHVGAPYRLSRIFRRATAREPWNRYKNGAEMAADLHRA